MSVKGSTWRRHKYVAINNGRYVYPENMPKEEKVTPKDTAEKSLVEKIEEKTTSAAARNDKIDQQIKTDYESLYKKIDNWVANTTLGKIRDMTIKDLIDLLKHDGMDDDQVEEFLAHEGRLGMKWGLRNGPPYPLGGDQLSAAEKKAGGVSKSAKEKYGELKNKITKAKDSVAKKEEPKKEPVKKEEPKKEPPKATITKSEAAQYPTRLASAQDVYRNRSMYTNQELQNYLNRVNLERQVGELAKREYEAAHPVKTFVKRKGSQLIDRTIDNAYNSGMNQIKSLISEAIEPPKNNSGPSIADIKNNPDKYTTKQIQDAYSRYNTMDKIKNIP